jgi:hypothetical protein
VAPLNEVDQLLLTCPPGASRQTHEFGVLALGQAPCLRERVQCEEAAVILQRLAGCRLADPTAQVRLGEAELVGRSSDELLS